MSSVTTSDAAGVGAAFDLPAAWLPFVPAGTTDPQADAQRRVAHRVKAEPALRPVEPGMVAALVTASTSSTSRYGAVRFEHQQLVGLLLAQLNLDVIRREPQPNDDALAEVLAFVEEETDRADYVSPLISRVELPLGPAAVVDAVKALPSDDGDGDDAEEPDRAVLWHVVDVWISCEDPLVFVQARLSTTAFGQTDQLRAELDQILGSLRLVPEAGPETP